MIEAKKGSGDVIADLGLPDAEKRLAKPELALRIAEAIRARRLN